MAMPILPTPPRYVATYGAAGPGTGPPVPVPTGLHPDLWADFAQHVFVLDENDTTVCHFWMGELQTHTAYGKYIYRAHVGPTPVRRDAFAHRFAYAAFADLSPKPRPKATNRYRPLSLIPDLPLPPPPVFGDTVHVRHRCNAPLCTPVTAATAAVHLRRGDAADNAMDREIAGRGGSRRHSIARKGADLRDRKEISLELQAAIKTGLDLRLPPAGLLAAVDQVYAAGDPYQGQLSLLAVPPRSTLNRLRLVK